MGKRGFVYIMASRRNGTLYIGVTSNLIQRAFQHRNGVIDGFTKKHGCKSLVWYAVFDALDDARLRERQMKKWNRDWKLRQIDAMNPDWNDLYPTLFS